MMAEEIPTNTCAFDILLRRNVPHILENIFFSLDYDSFMACSKVCNTWCDLHSTERYQQKLLEEKWKKEEKEDQLRRHSWFGNAEEVRVLLSSGVKQRPNGHGTSPLHYARKVEVIKQLIDAGGELNGGDGRGYTPLHLHVTYYDEEVIKLLLDEGANPNCVDNAGRTPLHRAAITGRKYRVKLLLDAGANPYQADHSGKTPVSVASDYGYICVVELLKRPRGDRPTIGKADNRPQRPHLPPLANLMSQQMGYK